jgi:hypothetical protein
VAPLALALLAPGAVLNVWLVTTLQYRRALRKEEFVGELPLYGRPHPRHRPHPDDE